MLEGEDMYDTFVQNVEVAGRTYEFWKKVSGSPVDISFAIFDGDEMVLECSLKFHLFMKHSDPNWMMAYDILDESMALAMTKHLQRNLVIKENEAKMNKMKMEQKLAVFDAKVAKEKAKREKGRKNT